MRRSLDLLRGFWRRHPSALVGSVLLGMVLMVALLGPTLMRYGPMEAFDAERAAGRQHWLGTDSQGYDLFTRLVYGARTTLRIALLATLLALTVGTLVGAACGLAGGLLDLLLMRLVDFVMSFPSFLLAMVTVAILGKDLDKLIVAVGIVGAPLFARQVRAEAVRIRAMDFVVAAHAIGAAPSRILRCHVLPNSIGPITVLATLSMGSAVLDVAGLTFLGLGGDPYKTSEWGLILNQGWREIGRGTLQVTCAGTAIFMTVLAFNLLGDALRDELDPLF